MRVKIGNTWHDSDWEPILVEAYGKDAEELAKLVKVPEGFAASALFIPKKLTYPVMLIIKDWMRGIG